jgi:hypothetical protein
MQSASQGLLRLGLGLGQPEKRGGRPLCVGVQRFLQDLGCATNAVLLATGLHLHLYTGLHLHDLHSHFYLLGFHSAWHYGGAHPFLSHYSCLLPPAAVQPAAKNAHHDASNADDADGVATAVAASACNATALNMQRKGT